MKSTNTLTTTTKKSLLKSQRLKSPEADADALEAVEKNSRKRPTTMN
jgi:hypothetical protein